MINLKEEDSDETNIIRLKCLDLFHKNCLTKHAHNFKINELACPLCNVKPFF